MVRSVLSVLFLGMVPASGGVQGHLADTLGRIAIAPPVARIQISEHLSASGSVILDAESAQELFAELPDTQRPMASLTKLMTALIIAENHDPAEWVKVPNSATDVDGMIAYLPAGHHFTVGDLLEALLVGSANDAALTLAVFHSGSVPAFVEEMNTRARGLGLLHTSFANPVGLDSPDQYSTPREIAWLGLRVLRMPLLRERMAMRTARIASREGRSIDLTHTHTLLHTDERILAGKTGTTTGAGECLLSLVEEQGRQYLVVLLGSAERYGDMRSLLRSLAPPVLSARLEP